MGGRGAIEGPRCNWACGTESRGARVGTEKSSGRGSVWTPELPSRLRPHVIQTCLRPSLGLRFPIPKCRACQEMPQGPSARIMKDSQARAGTSFWVPKPHFRAFSVPSQLTLTLPHSPTVPLWVSSARGGPRNQYNRLSTLRKAQTRGGGAGSLLPPSKDVAGLGRRSFEIKGRGRRGETTRPK